ncbi:MAG: hypothetical protein AB8I08_03200 [Sandaracinaceae bacterium]
MRRRHATWMAGLVLLGGLAFVLRYTLLLDFEQYVAGLEDEHMAALQEQMAENFARLAEGEPIEPPVRPSRRARLDRDEVDALAARFAEVGLNDPVELGGVLQFRGLSSPEGAERFERRVHRLAEEQGAIPRMVVAMNEWRLDDVRRSRVERSRPDADAAWEHLDASQREAVDAAWQEHGGSIFGSILRLREALTDARRLGELQRTAALLESDPPEDRSLDGLREYAMQTIYEIDPESILDLDMVGCSYQLEPTASAQQVRLTLDCLRLDEPGVGDVAFEGLLVHLPLRPFNRVATEAALGVLAGRLIDASAYGELPVQGAVVEEWIVETERRTGCDIAYEPLATGETAELTARCGEETVTRTLEAPPR